MGIILKKSNLEFDELIGTNSFDDIFKNSIRDYYTYGFKSFKQFSKGRQRLNEHWKIFSKVLGTKWYFDKRRNGRNQITLKTMARGVDNPVDDLYFLHNLSQAGDYLNYFLELDKDVCFRGTIEQLPVTLEELEKVEGKDGEKNLVDVDEMEYAIIQNWHGEIVQGKKAEFPVRINRQLHIWSRSTRSRTSSFKDKYKNLRNKMKILQELGILGNMKDDPEQRNAWLRKEWESYHPDTKRYFNRKTSGDDYWYKSKLTMKELINCGIGAEDCQGDEKRSEFLNRFKDMCEFFSQYYPLGEVGTILARRCAGQADNETKGIFRFKHNYIQKSLYDYNLIDILVAIEKEGLCWIRYSHATNLNSYEAVIVPLEIRISVTNGREYVMYYDIREKKIKALRLEFIDKITVYSKVNSVKCQKRMIRKDGNKKNREIQNIEMQNIDENDIKKQVEMAKEMLSFVWGVEVTNCIVDDKWKARLKNYTIEINYNSENETYIKSRLKKEIRISDKNDCDLIQDGLLKICCFPTKELRSWVRSFYMRVKDVSGIDADGFAVASDVESMWHVYYGKKFLPGSVAAEVQREDKKEEIEFGYEIVGTEVPETDGHAALFDEIFSNYTVALANAVLKCSAPEGDDFDTVLESEIQNSFDYYNDYEVRWVTEKLKTYACENELIDTNGKTRFIAQEKDYLYGLLPVTKVEVRWLLTILDEPMAKMFLSKESITRIKNCLSIAPYKVQPFRIQAIKYYDRYKWEGNMSKSQEDTFMELRYLQKLYNAMNSKEKVRISYRNWEGEKRCVICAPAWIEYSRRDDIFRLWYVHHTKRQIRQINIPRIISIENIPKKHYNIEKEQDMLLQLLDQTMRQLKVEFYQGNKNLPDRILTEFSLWKKKCIYDTKTENFQMTLHYSSLDEKEILVRLMSYGPYIKIIAPDGNYVYKELTNRVAKQRQLIRDRDFERG